MATATATTTTYNPIFTKQDILLLDLEKGVDRLHEIASNTKDELNHQNKELDKLEKEINTDNTKINKINNNLVKFIKQNSYEFTIIFVLMVIFIILLLYTIYV